MTKYVVIYTDFGDTCDGLARVLGKYDSNESAQIAMNEDIRAYQKANPGEHYQINGQSANYVLVGDTEAGCQWQILCIS